MVSDLGGGTPEMAVVSGGSVPTRGNATGLDGTRVAAP